MPRRKIKLALIENRRARAATLAKRMEGVKKKLRELSTLCAVPVALVFACPDAGAAGAPYVWESEEGVVARYRALPPEVRAFHTHIKYLEAKLGKETAKLARVRQSGPDELAHWDEALKVMTQDELLRSIDDALWATRERMKTLGLPADDDGGGGDGRLDQIAPPLGHGVPSCTGSNPVDMDVGYLLQMLGHGSNINSRPDQIPPEASSNAVMPPLGHGVPSFTGSNPVDMDVGHLLDGRLDQIPRDSFHFQPRNADAETMQPAWYFPQRTGSNHVAADVHQWQVSRGYCGNAPYLNAVVPPVGYSSLDMGGSFVNNAPAPAQHSALVTNTPPHGLSLGVGGNSTSVDMQLRSSQEFQLLDASPGWQLHYLSDVHEGMNFGSEDSLWEN